MKVGDKVRFTGDWCRNTGNFTGDIPFAGGPVTEVRDMSDGLAFVTFDCPLLGKWTALSCNLEVYK